MRFRARCLFVLVLLLAAVPRFYGLDWDGAIGAHPDERFVVGAAESLRDSGQLNPFAVAPDLAYGHLPVYWLALVMGRGGADALFVGRILAALFDLGTVALTFALGRRLWGVRVGLLAMAFVGLMGLHVQQAHFYTVDAPLAFFTMGALFFAVRLAGRGRARDGWLAGVWAGLALGTKSSAAFLVIPLGAASAIAPGGRDARWRRALQMSGAALLAFALTNPFALLSFPVFLHNVAREAAIARGVLDVAYTRQYHATWPYVYQVVQQAVWGMGLPLAVAAFGGLARAVWRALRRPLSRAAWVVLVWAVAYFAFTGAMHVKFPRYLLPLTPVLAVYGARWLLSLGRRVRRWAVGGVLVGSLLHCLVVASVYGAPHPWVVTSGWFGEHVEPGAVVAVERWDHPLPVGGADVYRFRELPVFEEDTPAKWAEMERVLAEADVLVLASRRGYATLARWTERYPDTARYYRQLFAGGLGFEPAACFRRDPHLGPLVLADDPAAGLDFALPEVCAPESPWVVWLPRLDESYAVYDRPVVLVFRRVDEE